MGRIGIDERPTSGNTYTEGISVTENDIEIGKDAELNIFNNVQFNGKKIIAPRST